MTRSPFVLGLLGFCEFAPRVFLGLLGGPFVDRLDRRRMIIFLHSVEALAALSFAFLVLAGSIRVWHILSLVFVRGAAGSISHTASQTLLPSVVLREELVNAAAINAGVHNFTKILGPSAGGILIARIGPGYCLLITALSSLLTLIPLLRLTRLNAVPLARTGFVREFMEGVQFALRTPKVFFATFITFGNSVFGLPYAHFLPVFAREVLNTGASGLGILMAAPGAGAIVSSVIFTLFGHFREPMRQVLVSSLIFAGALVVFSVSDLMLLSLLALVCLGAMQMSFRVLARTIVQTATPTHLLGRVMGIYLSDQGLTSFGAFLLGGIASGIGMATTLVFAGSLCAVCSGYVWIKRIRLGV
jgi:predicted MFS family arabinose efflux permease